MENAPHPRGLCPFQEFGGICFGLARVQHYRLLQFRGERELCVEGVNLPVARRVSIVRIEAALADGHRTVGDRLANCLRITYVIPRGCIVGMNSGGKEHEAGVTVSQLSGAARGRGGLADTDKGPRTFCAGPLDHRVRFVSERGVGQMHMTISKDGHARYRAATRSAFREPLPAAASVPALTARLVESEVVRGYLDSIQIRKGPAT